MSHTETVADHLLSRLRAWGVETVYGYPGDGINGLLAAWGRAADQPRFIQARHEEMAAFEAVGHAKFGRGLGVCVATSGPGAIHLLNGLYDAALDHVPVLAVVGQTSRGALGGAYQQEVDLHALFADVAAYRETVTVPEQLPNVLDRAIRTALSRRAPAVLIVPADVQVLDHVPPDHAATMVPSSLDLGAWTTTPTDDALARAADVINEGTDVAILVGQGAATAGPEVEQLAETVGAGVAKALLGKDALPDTLPYVTGGVGLLGTRPSQDLMEGCDTLVVIGSSFPYSRFLPEYGTARAVQIDVDPGLIGMRYPFEVNLVGDARATLERLLPLIHPKEGARERLAGIAASMERWHDTLARQAELVSADPINPQYVAHALDPLLPDDAILTVDSASVTTWYARHIRMRGTMRGSVSGTLASMGCAVPYAIGAKFAHPERPAVALVGDGAMQMNGMNELITAAKYRHAWDNPHLTVGVWNNRDLNQVTWEMRAMTGAPQFLPSQELPDVPYAAFARSLGLTGIRVERPEDVEAAWREALSAPGPAVVEFLTDPSVPPIPPQATWEQLESLAKALLRGDRDRADVVRKGLKSKLQEYLSSRPDDQADQRH
ncbi:thiamine pyrophosphate-requiring protein [Streptomyces radicis]|uniref:Thiamine pyrophosphate-requiring protein n=1 Tax=Streptomyces radicis TaxID=1750517 RepID=A0A3A9VY82_9ACTN|nr:thiamine pyrophosphate-requiring protein [Streptomyces radicis]RKN05690.1 thiamine pyrophosphate-requiring protein [Streptomyces radicis]RKN17529.1 thiamine pyrophosphate-requiring protein [Streptomyces radicis]